MGLAVACATAPTTPVSVLSDVSVDRDGDATVVGLQGASQAVFTAFRGEQPSRVVVDLPGVRPDGIAPDVPVYDGLVDEVAISEYAGVGSEPATRVEVMLQAEAEFEVTPAGDRLEIRVVPAPAGEFGASDFDDTQWEQTDAAPELGDSAAAPAAAAMPSGPASKLLAVEHEGSHEGTVVRVRTDGSLAGLQSFTLDAPERLVIDLLGLTVASGVEGTTRVDSAHVSQVRVGAHSDKVRLVVDAAREEALSERRLLPVADGLVVALGVGATVDAAFESAAQVAALPAAAAETGELLESAADAFEPEADVALELEPETALDQEFEARFEEDLAAEPASQPVVAAASVERVEFFADGDADRVVVESDRPVEYRVFRPDAETFVLLLPGSELGPNGATHYAPDPGGPVALVSAFAQPELDTPEVRVVVKRASGLEPALRQEGNAIVMAFERSQVASTLPVLEEEGQIQTASAADAEAASDLPEMLDPPLPVVAAQPPLDGAPPAAIDPEETIDYLEEGGLLDGKEYVGRRISLDFKDVDIRDVLRLIADVSDLNIIAGDEVGGNVTIRLIDVPWDQALDVILLTKGLGFIRVGNVLRIAPGEILKQEEEARLQERRAKEKLEDLVVKLQPVNYANVKEVSDLVRRLLTPRGSVDIDERTNTIIMKDIAAVIDEGTALIKAIDTQTPQVMIEARIVEASLDFSREIGTEFGFGSQPDEDEDDFTIGGMKPITRQDGQFPFNQANNVAVTNPITLNPAGLLNLGAFILDDRVDVDLRIAAAEVNGEGKVISSPRVVTLDNREAIIEQGVS
ncbi:MAG: AMIN domain-containing protein, partial [Myxococcota bacterium]|nr:AMIN domain-containing protein [Myxococcota bacterium]